MIVRVICYLFIAIILHSLIALSLYLWYWIEIVKYTCAHIRYSWFRQMASFPMIVHNSLYVIHHWHKARQCLIRSLFPPIFSLYSTCRGIWTRFANSYILLWFPLQWHHNGRDCVSNHLPNKCLLNLLFRRSSKKTSKLRVTGHCEGNSPVTGEFPAQRASYEENVSILWYREDWPSSLTRLMIT